MPYRGRCGAWADAYHSTLMQFTPAPHTTQNWHLAKPAASGKRGMVVSQIEERGRSRRRGARCRRQRDRCRGRDRAGARGASSRGIPGSAASATRWCIAPGRRAPRPSISGRPRRPALDPARFKLTGRMAADLFAWPEVEGDANIHGPLSFVIPSAVAGYAEMHRRWGRLPLAEIAAPAIALAKRGLPQDWYTTLKVANSAADPAQISGERAHLSARRAAAGAALSGRLGYFRLGKLPETLERLAQAGWRDFYEGEIAASIVADVKAHGRRAVGRRICANCKARVAPATEVRVARPHACSSPVR